MPLRSAAPSGKERVAKDQQLLAKQANEVKQARTTSKERAQSASRPARKPGLPAAAVQAAQSPPPQTTASGRPKSNTTLVTNDHELFIGCDAMKSALGKAPKAKGGDLIKMAEWVKSDQW